MMNDTETIWPEPNTSILAPCVRCGDPTPEHEMLNDECLRCILMDEVDRYLLLVLS